MVPFLRGTSVNFRGCILGLRVSIITVGSAIGSTMMPVVTSTSLSAPWNIAVEMLDMAMRLQLKAQEFPREKNRWKQWCVHPGYVGLYRGILLYQSIPLDLRNGIVESYPSSNITLAHCSVSNWSVFRWRSLYVSGSVFPWIFQRVAAAPGIHL